MTLAATITWGRSTQGAVQGVISPPPPVLATDAGKAEGRLEQRRGRLDDAPPPPTPLRLTPAPVLKKKIEKDLNSFHFSSLPKSLFFFIHFESEILFFFYSPSFFSLLFFVFLWCSKGCMFWRVF